jgi:hypothetical protein
MNVTEIGLQSSQSYSDDDVTRFETVLVISDGGR